MNLQKRLAAEVMNCSPKRVVFDENRIEEIEEAITKADVRRLVKTGAIIQMQKQGVSRSRANERKTQKAKGRRRGQGSRKGVASSRGDTKKRLWMNKVRLQRRFIASLKRTNQVTQENYRDLYRKVKGGLFRSKRHIDLYLEEKGVLKGKSK
ncbi:MAG TPA: 50S ribosomal protein L19e [Candidatus Nanoarchaeia archaeon]|nr:50S ribosomal protein L19e [Candidatus Nanoarchaeia archaeon]